MADQLVVCSMFVEYIVRLLLLSKLITKRQPCISSLAFNLLWRVRVTNNLIIDRNVQNIHCAETQDFIFAINWHIQHLQEMINDK